MLSLIGVSINPEDATLHMIMPFMDHGDVKSFLKSKRGDKIEFNNFPKVSINISVFYGKSRLAVMNYMAKYSRMGHH